MIQRIQSLFLLLAIVGSVLLLLIPAFYLVPVSGMPGDIYSITLLKVTVINGESLKELIKNWPAIVLNGLMAVLYIVSILVYRKRLQQVKICNVLLILHAVLFLILIYQWRQFSSLAGSDHIFKPGWGIAIIGADMLLIIAARFYILKDEALVRSADRLR